MKYTVLRPRGRALKHRNGARSDGARKEAKSTCRRGHHFPGLSPVALPGFALDRIRVRGDGQQYACNIRTDFAIMAGSYQQPFATKKGDWQEIVLPIHDFVATSFGQIMRDAPKLDTENIRSFGFTISDKQAGPFKLEVDWIRAIKKVQRASG